MITDILTVGDKVRFGNNYYEVECAWISSGSMMYNIKNTGPGSMMMGVSGSQLYPLDTNKDWLKKIGYTENGVWLEKGKLSFSFDVFPRCVYTFGEGVYSNIPFPRWLHQVQHLERVLKIK